MVPQKYIKDYRLDYVPGKKGVLKPVPVYIGKTFCFEKDRKVVKKTKVSLIIWFLATVVFFLAPLLSEALPDFRKYYIMLPYAVMIFPVFFAGCGLFNVLTAKEPVTREKKDKAQPKIKASCFLAMLLSGVSAIGQVLYMATNTIAKESLFVFLCTVGCCISNLVMFLRCRDVAMEEKQKLFPGGKNE